MRRWLILAALGLGSTPAHALDAHMWGLGARLGTMVIPGGYPAWFPGPIADAIEAGDSTLERVRGDVSFGLAGLYYVDAGSRMGLDTSLGLGAGLFDAHFVVKYDVVARAGAMDFLFGGGAGAGTQTFRGEGSERLKIAYFPLKAEVAAMARDRTRAYQGSLFFQWNIPSSHRYENEALEDTDVGGVFNYFFVGAEVAVFFGDFVPPAKESGGGRRRRRQ